MIDACEVWQMWVHVFVAPSSRSYDSGVFNRDEMIDWEDKQAADKTWVALVAYFSKIYKKNQRYGGTTAQGHGYGKAANAANEQTDPGVVFQEAMKEVALAATADKEHIQQMLDTADDIIAIVKRQQATIEKQAQQITDLIAQNGKYADIISKFEPNKAPTVRRTPRGGRGRGSKAQREKEQREKEEEEDKDNNPSDRPACSVCGLKSHKTNDCWELEKNKDKRPPGWKSIFE